MKKIIFLLFCMTLPMHIMLAQNNSIPGFNAKTDTPVVEEVIPSDEAIPALLAETETSVVEQP
ncbi:MAG TPA: hypothetical protein DDW70_04435, partial [Rikenellaceae bacterium]|nr:hypothetical protein [Rikenellaceae bacterium]